MSSSNRIMYNNTLSMNNALATATTTTVMIFDDYYDTVQESLYSMYTTLFVLCVLVLGTLTTYLHYLPSLVVMLSFPLSSPPQFLFSFLFFILTSFFSLLYSTPSPPPPSPFRNVFFLFRCQQTYHQSHRTFGRFGAKNFGQSVRGRI